MIQNKRPWCLGAAYVTAEFAGNVTTGVTILKMNVPFARWELMPWENT